MGTPTFQRRTTARVKKVAQDLRFVAFYHRGEERLNACMHDYAGRAFVYVLTSKYEGEEYILYVGKTKTQYTRFLSHSHHYEYDHIYLFECAPEALDRCEAAVIKEFRPLFNRQHNPDAERFKTLFEIDYDAEQSAETIRQYLERYARYKQAGVYGFALPIHLYAALEKESHLQGCNCSDYIQLLLEKALCKETTKLLTTDQDSNVKTNLISAKEYGKLHGKSREQVKAYLVQQDRIAGIKIGRDWVIPRDAKFPEDMREAAGRRS